MTNPVLRLIRRYRPPRWVFWILGAAIAFTGAYVARGLSEQVPLDQRIPYWFVGSIFIFAGLYVIALGTRARQQRWEQQRIDED